MSEMQIREQQLAKLGITAEQFEAWLDRSTSYTPLFEEKNVTQTAKSGLDGYDRDEMLLCS